MKSKIKKEKEKEKEKPQLWAKIQVSGRSIDHRTYHASAVYKKELYVYGGSQLNKRAFGDF